MKKRIISFLLTFVLLFALIPMQAEAATKLTQYVNVETAKTSSVSAGTIRYVNQTESYSTYFYDLYWGNNKSVAGIQCNLASVSMALSYIGINKLPANMTAYSAPSTIVSGTGASVNKPTSVSAGIDRMQAGNGKYSPVVIWMDEYHTSYGTYEHWVVVADRVSGNTYYVVDPAYGIGQGAYYKVTINGNTLTAWGKNSTIGGYYQFYNSSASIKPVLTIKYNTNGGTISSDTYSVGTGGAVQKGSSVFSVQWPYDYGHENGLANASSFGMSRTGYNFVGWSLSKDGSTRVFGEAEKIKSQDIYPNLKNGNATVTLYAIWKPVLTIKYNTNGGTISSDTYSVGTGGAVQKGSSVFSVQWPYDYGHENGLANASSFGMSRAGYAFKGWSLSKDGSSRVFTQDEIIKSQEIYPNLKNGSATVTLYAIWKPVLTIKYNTNGGTISSDTYSMGTGGAVQKGDAALLSKWEYDYGPEKGLFNASTFGMSRAGYNFDGWSLSKDGSTRIFGQDEQIKSQDIYPDLKNGGKTVTLYAIWTPKPAQVTFEPESLVMHIGQTTSVKTSVFGVDVKGFEVTSDKSAVGASVRWIQSSDQTYVFDINVVANYSGNANIELKLNDAGGQIIASKILPVTVLPLEAPKITTEIKAETGKPTLSWTKVYGAAKYEVYRATSANGTYSKIFSSATALSCTNTINVVRGTTYYYKVRAIDANGAAGAFSDIKSIACVCAQPVITVTSNNDAGTITVKWNAVEGATKYEVYRATSANGTYSKIFSSTTALSCTNTINVVPGTTYYYKVIARGTTSNADSAYSAVVSGKISRQLAAPTVTLTNDAATGKVVVNWKAVSGAAKYEVYRAASKTGTYSKILTTTSLTCLNKLNATPGTIYYYKVRALDASGTAGEYSAPQYRCVDCPQPVVTVLLNSSGKPVVKWNAVDGAAKYEVYRAASSDGTYSKIFSSETALSCTNTNNVVSGTTYYYKVIARGAATNSDSAYSAVVSIKAP